MKIYLIRHSESVDDIEDCYGGAADFALTDNGKQQAHTFISKIASWNIGRIYTSPYKRALQTAEIIKEKCGCSLEIVDDIREINTYGILSGVNKELAKEIFAYYLAKEEYKDFGYYKRKAFYGGEEPIDFDNRVHNGMEYILDDSSGMKEIAIVTHGGTYRSLFWNILNVREKIRGLEHLAYTVIDYTNSGFAIEEMKGIYFEK